MGWQLLCACPRSHWGNEAVSVCCSGRLCGPFITVRAQKHTERVVYGGELLLSNLSCFGLDNHRPHVASTPPWTHTSPSLPFGHRQPLYRLTPAAKICVCTANRGPGMALNETMTGDPSTPMFNQSAAYSRPCLPLLCLCGLRVNLWTSRVGARPHLPTDTSNIPPHSHRYFYCSGALYFAFPGTIQCFLFLWLTCTLLITWKWNNSNWLH